MMLHHRFASMNPLFCLHLPSSHPNASTPKAAWATGPRPPTFLPTDVPQKSQICPLVSRIREPGLNNARYRTAPLGGFLLPLPNTADSRPFLPCRCTGRFRQQSDDRRTNEIREGF